MNQIKHLDGIKSQFVDTGRLRTHYLSAGRPEKPAIIFLHGNACSSTIWEEMMLAFSDNFYCLAPDLRGYGLTDRSAKINALRGAMDWVDDLESFIRQMEILPINLIGHSLGGWICWSAIPQLKELIKSVVLIAPGPPFGFGGVQDRDGKPNNPDFAGSGAGVVNKEFAKNLEKGLKDAENPMFSPRAVMNRLFWKEDFTAEREEAILQSMLQMHYGREQYPGDYTDSKFWPFVAPGKFGPVNALSPKYNRDVVSELSRSVYKPPLLWLHGEDDQIISNQSLSDPGYQGKIGYRDEWPGEEVYPPQPMIDQIRFALEKYGGVVESEVITGVGHSPFIESPEHVYSTVRQFLFKMK